GLQQLFRHHRGVVADHPDRATAWLVAERVARTTAGLSRPHLVQPLPDPRASVAGAQPRVARAVVNGRDPGDLAAVDAAGGVAAASPGRATGATPRAARWQIVAARGGVTVVSRRPRPSAVPRCRRTRLRAMASAAPDRISPWEIPSAGSRRSDSPRGCP